MVTFLVDTLALAFAVSWIFVPAVVLVLLAKALREKPAATVEPFPTDAATTAVEHDRAPAAVLIP